MHTRTLAAAALFGIAAFGSANAADLDHRLPPGSPYEDQRFSDIYRHPAPPPPHYVEPHYAPPPIYREERYRDERYAPPPPYGHQPYPDRPGGHRYGAAPAAECLPQQVIRARLEARGWHDFHDPHVAGPVAHVRARRPNGRLFDLTVDRCSGQVLGAELIAHRAAEVPDWNHRDDRYRRY